jgi:hypothetical protein
VSDLILTAGIAFLLIALACAVAGLLGYFEVTWFPPDPPQGWTAICADPVDEHHRTLPDLTPWLPADVDPRDEWLHKGWYEQLHLEPTQVEQMLTDIENYLKERSQ